MNRIKLAGICILACIMGSLSLQAQQNIYVNQIGYLPNAPKYVYIDYQAQGFTVFNMETGESAFEGAFELRSTYDSISGIAVYQGDFSELNAEGSYIIQIHNSLNSGITSYPFAISNEVYDEMIQVANKSLFLQRCGMPMEEKYAGKYARKVCHLDDAEYHHTATLKGKKDVTGGWHDAGDYGKYIAPGSVTLARYYWAYLLAPSFLGNDGWGIPESGNGLADVMDEMRYELEWMLKMQREDGAVHEKVHSKDYVQFVMPSEGHLPRYIYQVSSTATGDYAAIMAWTYRMFKSIDKEFAEECLESAKKAYDYLEKNPEIFPEGGFKNPEDTHAGGYSDDYDKDERLWAAIEMYISTGKEKYHNDFVELNKEFGDQFAETTWRNASSFAYFSYLLHDFEKDSEMEISIKKRLINRCDSHLEIADADGFRAAMLADDYVWGSTGSMLSRALNHIVAFEVSKDKKYLDLATEQLNGVLGVNAMKTCYVTGIGTKTVLHLHHAPSCADLVPGPIPGILTGGPNKHLNDDALKRSFDENTPPAKTFLDNEESYASNENTIYTNASLVFVAAYISKAYKDLQD